MSAASEILTRKPPQLNSPGFEYNQLYPSKFTISTELLESTAMWQNVISLSAPSFNGSSTVILPTDQFLSHVVLRVRLPNLVANQSLCRGWLYSLLDSVSFTLGSSGSSAISLSGDSILQTILSECYDVERRDEILKLGGEEQLGPALAGVGEVVPHIEAYVLIPTPFSTVCDMLPLDSTLLSAPVRIDIKFNPSSSIYGGIGARPTQFLAAELTLHQLKLSDQSASLRNKMTMDPTLTLSYPWKMSVPFTTQQFQGHRDGDPGTQCQVQLQAFPDADLLGIVLWCVSDEDKAPSGNSTPNPWNTDEISDLVIEFNGVQIYRMNGKQHKLAGLLQQPTGAAYFDHSIVAPGAAEPFVSYPKKCYPIFLDFTRMRSCPDNSKMNNTWRLPNQTLTCKFNTSKTGTYRMYCTYMMNAVALFASGVSSIIL